MWARAVAKSLETAAGWLGRRLPMPGLARALIRALIRALFRTLGRTSIWAQWLCGLGLAALTAPAAAGPAATNAGTSAGTSAAAPLTVCMAANNPPLSHQANGQPRGLDVRIASAAAAALGRDLVVLLFESDYEKESSLTHEVNALLSAGVCDAVSGFPLLHSNLGPATRATSRTPDYPGAKRKRDRPFVPLGTLAASRAYLAATLGVVLRDGTVPMARLGDLGERRLGVVSGTLAGSVAMTWRNGKLRPNLVSLTQREDALAELAQPASPRFDALFLPLALFDGWKLQHPGTALVAAGMRRPIGINLGFVTLQAAADVRGALDRVIGQTLGDGNLARWAADEGVSWAPPVAPEVSSGPSMADLAAD